MKLKTVSLFITLLQGLLLAPLVPGQERPQAGPARNEEFFIISSVDVRKKHVVLKRPTEVTELMQLTPTTVYLSEQGKPLQLRDLRAGDTVYITFLRNASGARIATRIRMGPMTLQEVHRKYLQSGEADGKWIH